MTAPGHVTVDLSDYLQLFGCRECAPKGNPQGLFLLRKGSMEGWDSTPPVRSGVEDAPNADGAFDNPGYYTARRFVLSGWIEAESQGQLEQAKARLRGAITARSSVPIWVSKGSLDLSATVKLDGDVRITDQPSLPKGAWKADFTLPLVAADPRKYGHVNKFSMASFGVAQDLFHRGNYLASPKVYVTGNALGGWKLVYPQSGSVFIYTGPLVSGQEHVVDMSTGHVTVNGVIQDGDIGAASLWRIQPGLKSPMRIEPIGSGTADGVAYVTDTYI